MKPTILSLSSSEISVNLRAMRYELSTEEHLTYFTGGRNSEIINENSTSGFH